MSAPIGTLRDECGPAFTSVDAFSSNKIKKKCSHRNTPHSISTSFLSLPPPPVQLQRDLRAGTGWLLAVPRLPRRQIRQPQQGDRMRGLPARPVHQPHGRGFRVRGVPRGSVLPKPLGLLPGGPTAMHSVQPEQRQARRQLLLSGRSWPEAMQEVQKLGSDWRPLLRRGVRRNHIRGGTLLGLVHPQIEVQRSAGRL